MKLTEWLQNKDKNDQATFIISKTVKDDYYPSYYSEYKTTPLRTVWEWLDSEAGEKYIVINADHPPIDVTGNWCKWYKKGRLHCAMITTKEDIFKRYNEQQAIRMLEYYDNEVRK